MSLARSDAHPVALVGSWSCGSAVIGSDPLVVLEEPEDPFAVLSVLPGVDSAPAGAVGGGWIGYLGYGLGRLVEDLPPPPPRPVAVPRAILGFFDHLLRRDASGAWWFEALWSDDRAERLTERLQLWRRRASEASAGVTSYTCGPFRALPDPDAHLVAVARAIEHIRSGDVFQVNVCMRLEAEFSGDPIDLFNVGVERLRPRFGAFLGHPRLSVASFSPELFVRRSGHLVTSSPIKGTARRSSSTSQGSEQLSNSAKDRAENVMIVDLVRNDLGRVCRYGTVRVPDLCRVEAHPGVWHLVSDVAGELPAEASDSDLLRAAFPPGSVTGAPKVRAMELISALEATDREVYTGAIGIVSPVSGLETNVAIRTFELAEAKAWLGVGGGIVSDSDPCRELQECLDKAGPLLRAVGAKLASARPLSPAPGSSAESPRTARTPESGAGVFETILVVGGRPVELESHLGRLGASVSRLYGSRSPVDLGGRVTGLAAGRSGRHRLRVHAQPAPDGSVTFSLSVAAAPGSFEGEPGAPLVLVPEELPGGLGGHKWHDRRFLAERRELLRLAPEQQLLFVDEDGLVLETERCNVFAVVDGGLVTPPCDGRILPGTAREALLRAATVLGTEVLVRPLLLRELARADEVLVTNAIVGLAPVRELLGGRRWELWPVTGDLAAALADLWDAPVGSARGRPGGPRSGGFQWSGPASIR